MHDYRVLRIDRIETMMVVLVPVTLAELAFPASRTAAWLNAAGVAIVAALFLAGAFFAWFGWPHIVRVKVFHLPLYAHRRSCWSRLRRVSRG